MRPCRELGFCWGWLPSLLDQWFLQNEKKNQQPFFCSLPNNNNFTNASLRLCGWLCVCVNSEREIIANGFCCVVFLLLLMIKHSSSVFPGFGTYDLWRSSIFNNWFIWGCDDNFLWAINWFGYGQLRKKWAVSWLGNPDGNF